MVFASHSAQLPAASVEVSSGACACQPWLNRPRCQAQARSGYTLMEILAVIAIASILATLTIPAVSGLTSHNRAREAAETASTIFASARQHAITRNTYTWVAFSEVEGGAGQLLVLTVASRNGNDPVGFDGGLVDIGSADSAVTPIAKVATLQAVQLQGEADIDVSLYPRLQSLLSKSPSHGPSDATEVLAGEGVKFQYQRSQFQNAIQFTPRGEARVQEAPTAVHYMMFRGKLGDSQALVQIKGISGIASTYRPE